MCVCDRVTNLGHPKKNTRKAQFPKYISLILGARHQTHTHNSITGKTIIIFEKCHIFYLSLRYLQCSRIYEYTKSTEKSGTKESY